MTDAWDLPSATVLRETPDQRELARKSQHGTVALGADMPQREPGGVNPAPPCDIVQPACLLPRLSIQSEEIPRSP